MSNEITTVEARQGFEPGDVVTMKSGGLSMTVSRSPVNDHMYVTAGVEVMWMNDAGKLRSEILPAVLLTILPAPEPLNLTSLPDELQAELNALPEHARSFALNAAIEMVADFASDVRVNG